MPRSNRLFEIIQILRAANRPVTALQLSQNLEVSPRTIYRDIAALQAMNTPVDGEAGIGYILRSNYDLPPLNFDREEIEALRVGLLLLSRTGDSTLQTAARRVCEKIDALHSKMDWLQVSPWGASEDRADLGCISKALLRDAIRSENKLRLTYVDGNEKRTERTIRPPGAAVSSGMRHVGWLV